MAEAATERRPATQEPLRLEAEAVLLDIEGTLSPNGFHVDRNGVMAKCPSKYEPSKGALPNTSGS